MKGVPFKLETLQEVYDNSPSGVIVGNIEWDRFRYLDAQTGGANNVLISTTNSTNTGNNNTFTGFDCGLSNTSGNNNSNYGYQSGRQQTTSSNSTFIGYRAGRGISGGNNTAIGFSSMQLYTATGTRNVGMGSNSLSVLNSGTDNVAIGVNTGKSINSGSNNMLQGTNAGQKITTGTSNSVVGAQAAQQLTTESNNVLFGLSSGALLTGARNVFIGNLSGSTLTTVDDMLIVANSNTTTPLISGNFSTSELTINGDFHTAQGRYKNQTRVTASTYTLLDADEEIKANSDSNTIALTLQAGVAGRAVRIVNTGTSGNDITVAPNGAEDLLGVNSGFTLGDGEALVLSYETNDGWY